MRLLILDTGELEYSPPHKQPVPPAPILVILVITLGTSHSDNVRVNKWGLNCATVCSPCPTACRISYGK
jgi:hypothetical protein